MLRRSRNTLRSGEAATVTLDVHLHICTRGYEREARWAKTKGSRGGPGGATWAGNWAKKGAARGKARRRSQEGPMVQCSSCEIRWTLVAMGNAWERICPNSSGVYFKVAKTQGCSFLFMSFYIFKMSMHYALKKNIYFTVIKIIS